MQDDEDKVDRIDSPFEHANCISKLLFCYTLKIFKLGISRDIEESDLTKPLDAHKSSILGSRIAYNWSKEYEKAIEEKRNPSMTKVMLKTFWKELMFYGFVLFIMEMIVRLSQPLFIGLYIRYFNEENKNNTNPIRAPRYLMRLLYFWTPGQCHINQNEAIVYGSGIILTNLLVVMVIHPYFLAVLHIGMKMRVAACSLIYRKALRIKFSSLGGKTVGNTINLMSNDVNRFDVTPVHLHYLWLAPLQATAILYFLYKEMGIAALYGFLAVVCVIPIQVLMGVRLATLRNKSGARTDDRVMQMNEVIQSIQVIKMYTWEETFTSLISRLRKREIRILLRTSWLRGLMMSFIMFTTRSAIFLTVLSYVMLGEHITADKVFVVTAYYQIIRTTMTVYFPQGIGMLAESSVALKRIQAFMVTDETLIGDPSPLDPNWMISKRQLQRKRYSTLSDIALGICVKIIYGICKYGQDVCLDNINLEVYPGQLAAVVGPVGAGKTCLLNVMLGELPLYSGKLIVHGIISYAAQEPWLFVGSVRQNILFGREFEYSRYKEVIKVCALVRDFSLLPFGDRSIVGERGVSLSGGQRARVNLARAVYKRADIYLLDDPLSAVDINVGQQLFENCIKRYLGDKIVILVTHQLQYLKRADQIIVLDKGAIQGKGTFTELMGQETSFANMLLEIETQVTDTEKELDKIIRGLSITSAAFNSMIDIEGKKSRPLRFAEMRTLGSVEFTNYKEYFLAGANCCGILIMVLFFLGAQCLGSGGDFVLSKWVEVEEYRYYFGTAMSMAGWNNLSRNHYIIIYTTIIIATIIVAITRSIIFFTICMRSSSRLHDRMFTSVIHAHMRFFNVNSSGRILNRFSKDLGCIDELLPNAFIDTTQLMLNLLGAIVVVSIVEPYLLIPTAIMILAFYFLRRIYLATSRNVKRLEGITRSPVFAHLNASLQGLPTIRSNEAEIILVEEFDKLQDIHSSAWFMFLYTSRAFSFWLDIICCLFIGVVTFSFIVLAEGYRGSAVGLSITQCIGLTGLIQWGMRQSAELENQMTSVERVLEFTRIEHEPDLESTPDDKPPVQWPKFGRIEFINLSLQYSRFDPPVLKHLSFVIYPREKVGIVGRTGAGKSSLINALFRLAYFEGHILIDYLDVGVMGLHDLRRKISIIPQEPIIFSGSLRHNLDPFNEYSDDAVFNAIMDVELSNAVHSGKKCLDDVMSEGGSNLSVGQRQMVCLARAILRNNLILVLDEATANVDTQTDKFIQKTIRSKFAHCTVLTIAHRLHTVMDSDRVLVMDAGQCAEFDHPHILLQNKNSIFFDMVKKTGSGTSESLKKIAKENYQRRIADGTEN